MTNKKLKWIDEYCQTLTLTYEERALLEAMKIYIYKQEERIDFEKSKLDGKMWASKKRGT